MASPYSIPLWKSAPFVRLLLPFVAGIIFYRFTHLPLFVTLILIAVILTGLTIIPVLSLSLRYRLNSLRGLLLNALIFCFAGFLMWNKDVRNNKNWFGNRFTDSSAIIVKINAPPVEKERTFKAEGVVVQLSEQDTLHSAKGKVLIYFSKDDTAGLPKYGDRILISGGLQPIKNSGNPGAFDYSRYMGFQQTYHQVFLKKDNYMVLPGQQKNPLYSLIYSARDNVISILEKYIVGDKKVTGIGKALLIGYKEDLDKDVVQAYSNTGVVHIIAISGLHLGLIYVVLVWIFSRIPYIRRSPVAKVLLILGCLWLFSLITGASASVLRSAVMFTCIVIGKYLYKQPTIYNSLAASAFLLLCYDPLLLWDVGFQLSYCAVGGIVWLQKPIVNLIYFKNIYARKLWEMTALTLAAQVLTFPICIYYFHQFPTTFLLTNLICVPLSTVILFAEIVLIVLSAVPLLAGILGKFIYVLIWLMNKVIDLFDKMPLSLVDGIYATPATTFLLYGVIICTSVALLQRNKFYIKSALGFLIAFTGVWAFGKVTFAQQKKMIIYNVSRHTAVDFISGNNYFFYGDEDFVASGTLQNFNLKPARVALQAKESRDTLTSLSHSGYLWEFYNKKLMVIDSTVKLKQVSLKVSVDVLLISKKPKINISDITNAVNPAVIVIDGSNSLWKIGEWKKECEKLHLRCHITGEQGAFILDAD